jgi:hypothetical protein
MGPSCEIGLENVGITLEKVGIITVTLEIDLLGRMKRKARKGT